MGAGSVGVRGGATAVQLAKFLARGTLRGIGLGSTRQELEEALGEPDGEAKLKPAGRILRFSRVHATLRDNTVVGLSLQLRGHVAGALNEQHDGPPEPDDATSLYEFLDFIEKLGVRWQVRGELCFDTQFAIECESGAQVVFDLEGRRIDRCSLWAAEFPT